MTTTEKGLGIVVLTLVLFLGMMWMIWDSVPGQSSDSLPAITAPPVVAKSRASIDKSPKMQAERKRDYAGLNR